MRLGGGGNEAYRESFQQKAQPCGNLIPTIRFVLLVGSTPGLVLPADRLRAALPVGTNRAPSQCFVLSPSHFRDLLSFLTNRSRAKRMPVQKRHERFQSNSVKKAFFRVFIDFVWQATLAQKKGGPAVADKNVPVK